MTNLELNDTQTKALIREVDEIIRNDRYFLSPRIVVLREILAMLRPEPDRPAPPPLRNYEPQARGAIGDGATAVRPIVGLPA